MFRNDKEEELKRLEEELLAQEEEADEEEYAEEAYDEEAEYEEATAIRQSNRPYKVYNADKTDVDLDEYAETVFAGRRKPVLPWLFAALTAVLLLLLYLYLKQGGYL